MRVGFHYIYTTHTAVPYIFVRELPFAACTYMHMHVGTSMTAGPNSVKSLVRNQAYILMQGNTTPLLIVARRFSASLDCFLLSKERERATAVY